VLYLTAHGRLEILNMPFPIYCTIGNTGKRAGMAVDAVIYAGEMFVIGYFRPFLDAQIRGISLDNFNIAQLVPSVNAFPPSFSQVVPAFHT